MNWLFYSINKKLVIFNERFNLPLQILKMMAYHTMLVRSTHNGHMLCLIASFAFLKSSSASSEKVLSQWFHVFQGTLLWSSHAASIAQGIPRDCSQEVLLIY